MDIIIPLIILVFIGLIAFSFIKDIGGGENSKTGVKKVVIAGSTSESWAEQTKPLGSAGERRNSPGGLFMSRTESEAVISLVDSMNQLLDAIGIPMPQIETPQQVFSSMSNDLRTKVAPFIYPSFGEGAGNLVNLRLDAITKAAEIHYRLSLYKEQSLTGHGKLAILAKIAPENLRVLLDGVVGMQKVHGERSGQLEGPFEKLAEQLIAAFSYDYAHKMLEGLDKDRSNPELLEMVRNISFLPAPADENEPLIRIEGEPVDEDSGEFVSWHGNGRGGKE